LDEWHIGCCLQAEEPSWPSDPTWASAPPRFAAE
jgi:hypothetical protein